MKIKDFILELEDKCNEISLLCINHLLKKLYNIEKDEETREKLLEIFRDYKNFIIYLNDYAGVIYRGYSSSIDEIYIDICKVLNIQWDNESLFNHRVSKLNKIDLKTILSLDDDLKDGVILKYQKQIEVIMKSKFYINNINRQDEVLKIKML